MRRVATVAPPLHHVAALAKGGPNLRGDSQILSLDAHTLKADRMAPLSEFIQLGLVAFPAFIREDHRFLFRRGLVIDMAGDTIHTLLGMF